ncbi:MAG: hypothetical protein BWX93_01961 [Bacteroidetes bacterium ADurb.Bin139]|nr:MAG: hypothetical protein BWX93_01961 [Bacteroidetes bacterium ADurb.Bin139]
MPVSAVSFGGRLKVISGSINAVSGISHGLMMPFFSPSRKSNKMALGDTSLPVPAVVGTQINRLSRLSSRFLPKTSEGFWVPEERAASSLPTSSTLPPPMATIAWGPKSLLCRCRFSKISVSGSACQE